VELLGRQPQARRVRTRHQGRLRARSSTPGSASNSTDGGDE
jgi:hypothetical protein